MSSIVKPGIFRNKPEVASCYVIQNKSFLWLWDNLKIGNHYKCKIKVNQGPFHTRFIPISTDSTDKLIMGHQQFSSLITN